MSARMSGIERVQKGSFGTKRMRQRKTRFPHPGEEKSARGGGGINVFARTSRRAIFSTLFEERVTRKYSYDDVTPSEITLRMVRDTEERREGEV